MKLYAFWRYGHFPHLLGGEVIGMDHEGRVKIKEYGGGTFTPVKILPYDQGKKIADDLRRLASRYDADLKALNEVWLEEARKIFPDVTLP